MLYKPYMFSKMDRIVHWQFQCSFFVTGIKSGSGRNFLCLEYRTDVWYKIRTNVLWGDQHETVHRQGRSTHIHRSQQSGQHSGCEGADGKGRPVEGLLLYRSGAAHL